MSDPKDLKDIEWIILDLLMRAKQKGVHRLSKTELLYNESIPVNLRVQLAFNAMLIDTSLVSWHGQEFAITDLGEEVFVSRFGKPSKVADVVIALPDRSGSLQ